MPVPARRHPLWLTLISLSVFAGCQSDPVTAPRELPVALFAQGDNATWTVNTLADPGDGTCDDTECTLREAIAAATPGGKIVIADGLQGDIKLGASLIIAKSLSVDGAGRIAIDAQQGGRVVGLGTMTGPITLARLTFKNGMTDGANGGGISIISSADVLLDSITVMGNQSAGLGGGVHVNGGSVTIRNSTIAANRSAIHGGGVNITHGTVTIVGSTISGNRAPSGGGIHNAADGITTVERSTISGNITEFQGAGILNLGTIIFRSSTITRNDAANGAGGISNSGNASLENSINVGNTGGSVDNCGGPNGVSTLGYNVVDGCNSGGPGDITVTASQVFTQVLDPMLADNGGPTKTHALIAGGRAIDAGYCPGQALDQRGFKRPVDAVGVTNVRDGCDIGAFELQGPVIPVADLMVSQAVNKTSVKQGDLLTYSVRVQNLGTESAPNVVLTNLLSSGVTFVSAGVNKGTVIAPPSGETGTVTWNLGTMTSAANEVATITVTVLVRGRTTITNTASVVGDVSDPNTANNSAAITVSVAAGGSGGGGGKKS